MCSGQLAWGSLNYDVSLPLRYDKPFFPHGKHAHRCPYRLGYKWGGYGAGVGAALTYSFPSSGAAWISDYLGAEPFDGFQPFTNAQKSAA